LTVVFCALWALQAPSSTTVIAAPRSCESLVDLTLPNTTITSAATVQAGTFVPPPAPGRGAAAPAAEAMRIYKTLPSFCRVAATLKPSSDSDIKVEVWLPSAEWNGKFQAVGNGGWAGVISYSALAAAVKDGYASASTDTGHVGGTGAFALGHPEKLIDFGHRAVHEMTTKAKAVVDAYYGSAPKLSLWNGCSQGGRQGIMEAMRYPGDYDAIAAGAASVGQSMLHGVRLAAYPIVHRSADSYIPPDKYPLIHKAALNACDAADGLEDGVIENPARCRFDPKVLECKGGDSPSCLTAAQVETARALYAPIKNPSTGAEMFPGLLQPGTELGWQILAGPQPYGTAVEAYKYIVFKDPNWDFRRFNPATDVDLAVKVDNGVVGLWNPDLRPFFKRGGKLLMYHGWADPQVPPVNSVRYFNDVVRTVGASAVGKSIQLYMVPGMGHCRGGAGVDTFDKMAALEQWIASGNAPESIPASRMVDGKVVRARPLCPSGKVARWDGKGNPDAASSFSCVTP
jgi:feruloyl esterase